MASMSGAQMLGPAAGMFLITLAVWMRLFQLRIAEMRSARVATERLALSGAKARLLSDTRASDNFANLFELPVLLYAGVLVVVQAGLQDAPYVWLAWSYVLLRALHSLIHCSYNRVMHRFVVYLLSSLVLFAFWLRLAWQLLA